MLAKLTGAEMVKTFSEMHIETSKRELLLLFKIQFKRFPEVGKDNDEIIFFYSWHEAEILKNKFYHLLLELQSLEINLLKS